MWLITFSGSFLFDDSVFLSILEILKTKIEKPIIIATRLTTIIIK